MARQSLNPMSNMEYDELDNAEIETQVYRRRRDAPITHLKFLRKKSGYTLESLSRITNISISYLSRLESGARRLNTDLIRRLSEAFNCDPAELLQESSHDVAIVTPVATVTDFSRKRRGDMVSRESPVPLYKVAPSEESEDKLMLKIYPPSEWLPRPLELFGRTNVLGLRCEEYFLPDFNPTATVFLESVNNNNLVPEATVVIMSGTSICIRKVWSIAPTSLQVCHLSDMEKLKVGASDVQLITVNRNGIDSMYRVVGFSDFGLK